MTIEELEERLEESIDNFSYEANVRPINFDMADKLDGYDYDEICRQFYYVMYDFKENIIEYLKNQNMTL